MDLRLFKAARLGDVASLHALLDEDPLLLDKTALAPTTETPLHVAALAGRPDFVHEIIYRKPSFAWELNQDGFSPLHIASAVGNKDVVKLLKFDPDLCLQEDKQGLIPLHYAAMKGRVSVIKELLKCCPESLKIRTSQGQTVFHLAVKNCQFETFKTLVETLDGDDVEDFVMAVDKDGNTVPQMAASSKQLKVLEYLERQSKVGMRSVEIIICGDELEEGNSDVAMPQANHPQKEVKETKARRGLKKPGSSRKTSLENMMLVTASFIATITFQGISPPEAIFKGGNGMDLAKNCTLSSVFSAKESCPRAMRYFFLSMVFNTAGFFFAIWLLLVSRSRHGRIVLAGAVYCMLITYILQSVAMYPRSTLFVIYIYGFIILGYYFVNVLMVIFLRYWMLMTRHGKKNGKLIGIQSFVWLNLMEVLPWISLPDISDEET